MFQTIEEALREGMKRISALGEEALKSDKKENTFGFSISSSYINALMRASRVLDQMVDEHNAEKAPASKSAYPNGWSDLRPEVQAFALAMEWKLRCNEHKGGWKKCKIDELVLRIKEELKELTDELLQKGEPEDNAQRKAFQNLQRVLMEFDDATLKDVQQVVAEAVGRRSLIEEIG